jgi:extracellular factor (EF) 3-hydroxypalmitic acid methyl ester biosynthesis protein
LGRLFDRYFQAQAAPQAVRNRMAMMGEWIVAESAADQDALHISVVGSAFGLEICDALARLDDGARSRMRVTLLDIDPAAIDFARQQLQPLLKPMQLTATSTNLFRLPDRPAAAKLLGGCNLVFCPGMFDYLDDAAATEMLRCLYGQLSAGGRLIVFQFAPHNPTRAYMEWFGNWYLTYRGEAAFRGLVEAADLIGAEVTYGAEPLGIDLFATIRRP